jgi:hypothetical protein
MPSITVKTIGVGDLATRVGADLHQFTKVAERAIYTHVATRGVANAVAEVSKVQPNAPVDRGAYRQSFKAAPIPGGAMLYNSRAYAGVLESGRRPGRKRPPVDVIAAWVLRKGLVGRSGNTKPNRDERKAARSIAFAIARKIGERGLPRDGQPMRIMEKAVEALLPELPAMIALRWAQYKGGK